MINFSVPVLLLAALMVAVAIIFYRGIGKGGEQPGLADRLALVAVLVSAPAMNVFSCLERACIPIGGIAVFVTIPIAIGCLSAPPGRREGRARFAHRLACLLMCIAAGVVSALRAG